MVPATNPTKGDLHWPVISTKEFWSDDHYEPHDGNLLTLPPDSNVLTCPAWSSGPREQPILDYAQDIKSAGLIMSGSKDDRTEPWQAPALAQAINRILLLSDVRGGLST